MKKKLIHLYTSFLSSVLLIPALECSSQAECLSTPKYTAGGYNGCSVRIDGKQLEFDSSMSLEKCTEYCKSLKEKNSASSDAHAITAEARSSGGATASNPPTTSGTLAAESSESALDLREFADNSSFFFDNSSACRLKSKEDLVSHHLGTTLELLRDIGASAEATSSSGASAAAAARGGRDEISSEQRHALIERLVAIRRVSVKDRPSESDQRALLDYWATREKLPRPSQLLGIKPEPVTFELSMDDEFALPPPMPSLIEMRYGKANLIKLVSSRDTSLLAQGIEYQKGGLANLVDIILSGIVHGYIGPMSTELDTSMSSLKHGPYWVVLDRHKLSDDRLDETERLLHSSERDSIYTDQYHLAYIIPDEKEELLRRALTHALEVGILSRAEHAKLADKIIPFAEYMRIPQDSNRLTEEELKKYLTGRASRK